MVLSSDWIIEQGFLTDPENYGQKSQIGYDLTVCKITKTNMGAIIGVEKNIIPSYGEVKLIHGCLLDETSTLYWSLSFGIYSLTLDQFCKLDRNHHARIFNRSSIQRAGALIISGIFDPGFTSQIGATLFVFQHLNIEFHARVAQFVVFENRGSDLYNGQYQGDKDRK